MATEFSLKWRTKTKGMPYTCDLRKCDLCLAEKLAMAQFEGVGLLNKQTELLSKCQHRNKIIITKIK